MAPGPPNLIRRRLVQAVAVAPLFPRLSKGSDQPHVIVVGAGAFGSWTAHHLGLLGAQVTLVDAWGPGNARSSSGGESRVIRSVYGDDRLYSEMVQRSFELWEALDASLDEALYTETGALWLLPEGGAGYVEASLPIMKSLGFPVEALSVSEARARWPQIRFDGVRRVYLERRAGALAARRCCQVVRDRAVAAGAAYRRAAAAPVGRAAGSSLSELVLTDGSRIAGDAFLFACGPWLGHVLPDVIGGAVRPTRQEVFYFGPPAGDGRFGPDRLPVWIDFGERIFYGLPDLRGRGFKIADDTRGDPVDPSSLNRRIRPEALQRARDFLARRFPDLARAPLLESRVCQYENSPDGHLIIDRHPELEDVWIAGGGSGHGFKLSPAAGELAALAIVANHPIPELFSIARLGELRDSGTQFERS